MGRWLDELKLRARELAQKIPYQQIRDSPSVKYYTDWGVFDRCGDPDIGITSDANATVGFDWYEPNIGFVNGSMVMSKLPEGVFALGLNELGDDYGKFILRSMDIGESKALARHVAGLLGGSYVEVRKDLTEPLRLFVGSSLNSQVLVPTHHTVVVNDGVRASLSLFIVNNGGCSSTTVEVYLGKDSALNLLTLSMGNSSPEYTVIKVISGDNSSLVARTLLIGGSMNHHREDYVLQGVNSRLNHLGLEIGLGTSRIDYQVNALHIGGSSSSYSRVLGIARDKSFIIHRALGRIMESAKWSDTNVEGKVFIMNDGAYAASVPVIMVDTGDVNGARHSAADASPDEEQINYLRLRGISKDEVTDLIIHELVSQFIESLPETYRADAETLRSLVISNIMKSSVGPK
ncbi:MAG: SufB/SufD family protein [Vulcanisaeta sp.]